MATGLSAGVLTLLPVESWFCVCASCCSSSMMELTAFWLSIEVDMRMRAYATVLMAVISDWNSVWEPAMTCAAAW